MYSGVSRELWSTLCALREMICYIILCVPVEIIIIISSEKNLALHILSVLRVVEGDEPLFQVWDRAVGILNRFARHKMYVSAYIRKKQANWYRIMILTKHNFPCSHVLIINILIYLYHYYIIITNLRELIYTCNNEISKRFSFTGFIFSV